MHGELPIQLHSLWHRNISKLIIFIFRNRTIQNGIEDKQTGTEGVYQFINLESKSFKVRKILNHIKTQIYQFNIKWGSLPSNLY